MYAVIKTGGKQYKVAENDRIAVEKLAGEAGGTVQLDQVLLVNDGSATTVGSPLVEGASVVAEVVEQTRGDKVIVFKKKRRHNYRRTKGHRQDLTVLRITEILTDGKKASKPKKKAAPKKAKEEEAPAAEADAEAPAAEESKSEE